MSLFSRRPRATWERRTASKLLAVLTMGTALAVPGALAFSQPASAVDDLHRQRHHRRRSEQSGRHVVLLDGRWQLHASCRRPGRGQPRRLEHDRLAERPVQADDPLYRRQQPEHRGSRREGRDQHRHRRSGRRSHGHRRQPHRPGLRRAVREPACRSRGDDRERLAERRRPERTFPSAPAYGGAFYNDGILSVSNRVLSDNSAYDGGWRRLRRRRRQLDLDHRTRR